MDIYLVDDDPAVRNVLQLILERDERCCLVGCGENGTEALEDLRHVRPELVLADFLMPGMDGVEFVRRAKKLFPAVRFVMLSQVSSKDMVAEAYDAGVDFFISKPVNSVEVLSVIGKVGELLTMDRTLDQLRSLLQDTPALQKEASVRSSAPQEGDGRRQAALTAILQKIGLGGDPACREIIQAAEYLADCGTQAETVTVAQCCAHFSASPKSMEQRIRRAAAAGLVNLANLGIEDYGNDTFTEYAGTLYHFEQVRREMDCIRGKSGQHGRASLKKFLYALAALSSER